MPWACARCATVTPARTTSTRKRTNRIRTSRFDPGQVHRLLALRARLRGGAGHLRADHRRAAASTRRSRRAGPAVHGFRVRVLRRLRAGLPHGDADGEARHRAGQPEHTVVTTCAYCGVGCAFEAEMKGDEVVRMVPWKDGGANRGHSCVKGRFAFGYATHPDRITTPMIRESIDEPWRAVSWDEAIAYAAGELRASRRSTAATRSAASPPRAAPTRRPTWCRRWCARRSATTTSTPARASATRPPATA